MSDNIRYKPRCQLVGKDGNIFNLIGLVVRELQENNLEEDAKELVDRIMVKNEANSYNEALCILMEYVEIE